MKDRILEIIKREHLSNADFADKIGISPATVSSILNGRNNPSLDVSLKSIKLIQILIWNGFYMVKEK